MSIELVGAGRNVGTSGSDIVGASGKEVRYCRAIHGHMMSTVEVDILLGGDCFVCQPVEALP